MLKGQCTDIFNINQIITPDQWFIRIDEK